MCEITRSLTRWEQKKKTILGKQKGLPCAQQLQMPITKEVFTLGKTCEKTKHVKRQKSFTISMFQL